MALVLYRQKLSLRAYTLAGLSTHSQINCTKKKMRESLDIFIVENIIEKFLIQTWKCAQTFPKTLKNIIIPTTAYLHIDELARPILQNQSCVILQFNIQNFRIHLWIRVFLAERKSVNQAWWYESGGQRQQIECFAMRWKQNEWCPKISTLFRI